MLEKIDVIEKVMQKVNERFAETMFVYDILGEGKRIDVPKEEVEEVEEMVLITEVSEESSYPMMVDIFDNYTENCYIAVYTDDFEQRWKVDKNTGDMSDLASDEASELLEGAECIGTYSVVHSELDEETLHTVLENMEDEDEDEEE